MVSALPFLSNSVKILKEFSSGTTGQISCRVSDKEEQLVNLSSRHTYRMDVSLQIYCTEVMGQLPGNGLEIINCRKAFAADMLHCSGT